VDRSPESDEAAARKARRTRPSSPKRLTYSLRLARLQKALSFSAYTRLFELAEDYDRELIIALAKKPQNPTEIAECRERLARTLKDLLPYEKPRLMTTKVQGDKDYPLFDLSALSDSELAFLRRTILKAQQVDERE
jgi:hypothetical protein